MLTITNKESIIGSPIQTNGSPNGRTRFWTVQSIKEVFTFHNPMAMYEIMVSRKLSIFEDEDIFIHLYRIDHNEIGYELYIKDQPKTNFKMVISKNELKDMNNLLTGIENLMKGQDL